jgi:hypothetical protein
MGNIPIAFYVLGALLTLYVVAATWGSKPRRRTRAVTPHARGRAR